MHRNRRSRSRSPISRSSDKETPYLHIRNLPRDWDFEKVKDFIRSCSQDKMVIKGLRFVEIIKNKGECIARFTCGAAALKGLRELDGKIVGDQKLVVKLCDSMPEQKGISQQNNQVESNQQDFDTYGLNNNFLSGLGIRPPLVNKIFINNLDPQVTKEKLHEVFSLAGKIIKLVLIRKTEGAEKLSAKIEYDHPVEAVQAVSMFHNQELYDRRILTRLDYLTKGSLQQLPSALKNIGPGLGGNGEPMTNIRLHVEIQALKNELKNKLEMLNSASMMQMNADAGTVLNTDNPANQLQLMSNMNSLNPFNNQVATNPMLNQVATNAVMNQLATNPMMQNTNALQNNGVSNPMQVWAGLMNNPLAMAMQSQSAYSNPNTWNSGSQVASQLLANQASMMQVNTDAAKLAMQRSKDNDQKRGYDDRDKVFADDNMDLVENRKKYRDEDEGNPENADMVIFTNLPPSVSSQVLKAKMCEVGDVKFVEMTGKGRAIVRFFSPRDGERCLKMFDKTRVDGQIIHVNYF